MCWRHMFCYFLVTENYLSLVDILWKTEVIGELYLVRSADENVGGSVVVIFSGYRKFLASRTTCGPSTKTWGFGGCFALFQVVDIYFCCGLWRQGGQSWEAKAGELVAFEY